MPLTRYPGVAHRIRQRLKALSYWRNGRPDIPRVARELSTPRLLFAAPERCDPVPASAARKRSGSR
jgi:hypothetical protein